MNPTKFRISFSPPGAAVVSGGLYALSQPLTEHYPPWAGLLGLVCLAPMLSLAPMRPRRTFLLWALCGYAYGFLSMNWVYFAHPLAAFVLPVGIGFFFGVFGLFWRVCPEGGMRLVCGAVAWAAVEYLRSVGPFSFCWGLVGYGPERAGLYHALAALLGPYAGSSVVFAFNAALVQPMRRTARASVFAALLVLALPLPAPAPGTPLRALIVQGGHPQIVKWSMRPDDLVADYLRATRHALADASEPVDLIVWPEVAITGLWNYRESIRASLHEYVRRTDTPLFTGVLTGIDEELPDGSVRHHYYNSAVLLTPDGEEQQYDKIHLVPWGETIPFANWIPGLRDLVVSAGGGEMDAGSRETIFTLPDGRRFACLICFESTLPHMARRRVNRGARFLVVITNDAWFYRTSALPQHLWSSRARAMESRIPVLRAANTGISAAIARNGSITARLPEQLTAAQVVEIDVKGESKTLYTRTGDVFAWLCLCVVASLLARKCFARRRDV